MVGGRVLFLNWVIQCEMINSVERIFGMIYQPE